VLQPIFENVNKVPFKLTELTRTKITILTTVSIDPPLPNVIDLFYKSFREETSWPTDGHDFLNMYLFYAFMPPGNEADHSPPSSAEVKNAWSYTSTPPYVFMAWCLVKYRIRLHGISI